MNSTIVILALHRVGRPPTTAKIRGLFTSPRLLSFQIQLLTRLGFVFTTLSDALSQEAGKFAVVTFDDGYADNYSEGLPILERIGIPATVFPITSDIGGKNVVWEQAGEDLPADMINWNSLAELQERGWEIGTHGARHVHLDRCAPDVVGVLVRSSMRVIEAMLGKPPVCFAYPYGSFDLKTKETIRAAGIRFAVTTRQPTPTDLSGRSDPLELTRICIGGRLPHHYVRAIRRTVSAVGLANAFRWLITDSVSRWVSRMQLSRSRDTASASEYVMSRDK